MARKLINRKDILNDLVGVILPKYFPEATLDTNRVSILGYLTETMAVSIEDTVTLEQRRAADYCPELSTSEVHVRQTAKIRSIGVDYATPGRAFAIIGVLKSFIDTRDYFGSDKVVPIYIEVEDGLRLQRALNREKKPENRRFKELCRRYLADSEDFSEDKIKDAGIDKRFENVDLSSCINEVKEYIRKNR